jgi:tetratricopeptide (TPR) repeat protein
MKTILSNYTRQVIVLILSLMPVFGCMSHKPRSTVSMDSQLSPQERADFAFTQGEAYSQNGKPKKAIELFKEALLFDPDSFTLKIRLATELVRVGSVRESIEIVDSVIEKDPRFVKALLLKASILSALKNNSEAIKTFEALLLIEPDNTDALTSLGALYAEEQKYESAIEQFQKLTALKSYSSPELAYYYLGRIFEEKGDNQSLNQALSAYLRALELKPGYVDALLSAVSIHLQQKNTAKAQDLLEKWQANEGVNLRVAETLANLYLASNQFDKALAQMRLVDSLNPQSLDVKLRMAGILMGKKEFQESANILESILIEVPDSDRVRFSLGAVYAELKEWDKAVLHFTQVPHFSSYYVDSVVQSVNILIEQNKISQAEKLLKTAIEKKDEAVQFYILYSTVLDDQKKYQENAKFLSDTREKFSDSSMILFLYAMSFDRMNDKDSALKWMKTVIEKDPDHALALNYIAYIYAEQNRELEEALTMAMRALKNDPDNPFIQDTVGWIYFQKGQFKKAVVWLEKAFNGAQNESVIMDHLGDVYYKLGWLDKAQVMYDLASESSDDEAFRVQVKIKLQALRVPDSKAAIKERIPAAVPPSK